MRGGSGGQVARYRESHHHHIVVTCTVYTHILRERRTRKPTVLSHSEPYFTRLQCETVLIKSKKGPICFSDTITILWPVAWILTWLSLVSQTRSRSFYTTEMEMFLLFYVASPHVRTVLPTSLGRIGVSERERGVERRSSD